MSTHVPPKEELPKRHTQNEILVMEVELAKLKMATAPMSVLCGHPPDDAERAVELFKLKTNLAIHKLFIEVNTAIAAHNYGVNNPHAPKATEYDLLLTEKGRLETYFANNNCWMLGQLNTKPGASVATTNHIASETRRLSAVIVAEMIELLTTLEQLEEKEAKPGRGTFGGLIVHEDPMGFLKDTENGKTWTPEVVDKSLMDPSIC